MRLAIVADWLVTFGGAEHVLAQCADMFPDAPLYTTVARPDAMGPLAGKTIHTSRLQRWYGLIGNHQILLPWMPQAMESLDLSAFDVVLSSSHAVAKGVIVRPGTVHVCYCHTPMRYAWEMEDQYLRDFRVPALLRKTVKRQLSRLRRWDLATAKRVDVFLANSLTTQERIKRIYARDSIVIPPPVDDRFFNGAIHEKRPEHYFLAVGRLVPYKRFDILIEAANALQLPLWIAGKGQEEARLRALAGPTVRFLGFVPDDDLPSLYAGANALLFPQEEDAGIVLLEAQACGTQVIAYRAGGALDVVVEGRTGVFASAQTADAIRTAIEHFRTQRWDRAFIREHARQFSRENFRAALGGEIERAFDGRERRN